MKKVVMKFFTNCLVCYRTKIEHTNTYRELRLLYVSEWKWNKYLYDKLRKDCVWS